MKTIIFVMPRLPFPMTSGRKTSLYHYCRILSKELGYRLVVAAFLENEDDPDQKPEFIDKLVILPKVGTKEKLVNLLVDSFIKHKKPMQVGLFWSKKAKNVIDKLIEEECPVAVISDMVRTTEYLKNVKCFKIADLDDMISLRYQRQLENDIEGINPYGAYLNSMPRIIQKILLNKYIKLAVVNNEIKLLKKYELSMGKIFDKVVFVAQGEADKLNHLLKEKEKAMAVPIGVDTEYFGEKVEKIEPDDNVYIGFLGQMSVAHNENGAINFIENILPLIQNKIPKAKFMIVGGGVTDRVKFYASDAVYLRGRVDDVRNYLTNCRVFVCPLTFGSGIKTKNLEAMAMGIPVVTTSVGAENINALDGKDWLIADDIQKFVDDIVRLITDDEYYNNIRLSGQKYVQEKWTWIAAQTQFAKIFESM